MKYSKREKKLVVILGLLCILLFAALLFVMYRNHYFSIFKQLTTSSYDYKGNAQYLQRQTLFELSPQKEADIVFVGDSITARCEWQEFFPDKTVLNRGIDSDVAEGVANRLSVITAAHPAQIYLMIGINDIRQNISTKTTLEHYTQIINDFQEQLPDTEIYIQSVLPIGDNTGMSNEDVEALNEQLMELAAEKEVTYIDLYSLLIDETGYLPDEYSVDGVHLTGAGYSIWLQEISKYIY